MAMPRQATYVLINHCATVPDTVTRRCVVWVLGSCIVACLVALGLAVTLPACTGFSQTSTAIVSPTSISVNGAVQRWVAFSQGPHPVYCSPGGTSGPSFNEAAKFKNAAPPQDCMTLGVSFRSTYLGTYQIIVGWDTDKHHFGSLQLRLTRSGNLEYGEFANGWNSVQVLPQKNFADGSWHTAVVVRNGSSSAYAEGALLVSLYVDGRLEGRGVLPKRRPKHLMYRASSARPGPRHQDKVFQGSIRDLRIYDHALGHQQRAVMAKDPCPRIVSEMEASKSASSH